MAATDEMQAGLGAPMRLMVQNAIQGHKNLATATSNHFAQVTGHAPSSGWGDFTQSLAAAMQDPDAAETHLGQMVEALGFHEDNFASQFEEHQYDKEKSAELRDDLHHLASTAAEHISALVEAVHAAKASPNDKIKVSNAYEAGYDMADFLHATHTMNESDVDMLNPESAHVMSQIELKNYRSPISFTSPDQIGFSLKGARRKAGKMWGSAKRKGRRARRAVSKKVIPRGVRRAFANRNSKASATLAIGGRSAAKDVFVKRGCIGKMTDTHLIQEEMRSGLAGRLNPERYQLDTVEKEQYDIDDLSAVRGGRWIVELENGTRGEHKRDLSFAFKVSDIAHELNATFSVNIQVQNTVVDGSTDVVPDTSPLVVGGGALPQNVILYSSPKALQPGATGVIFPQHTVPVEDRTFYMTKNGLVVVKAVISMNGKVKHTLTAVVPKFNSASRGSLRTIQGMIGEKIVSPAQEYNDFLPPPNYAVRTDEGNIWVVDGDKNLIVGRYDPSTDKIDRKGYPIPVPLPRDEFQRMEEMSEEELSSITSLGSVNEDDYGEPLPEFGESTVVTEPSPIFNEQDRQYRSTANDPATTDSFDDLMKDGKMMVMQIKSKGSLKDRQSTRPYILCYITPRDRNTGEYTLDGVMLVLPRLTKKRKIPQSERAASTSMQRNFASGYRMDRRDRRDAYKSRRDQEQ